MTGQGFGGLFDSLQASFAAATARAERDAADDLALSLRQDRDISEVLRDGGWVVKSGELAPAPIAAVGRDYVETPEALVPFAALTARRTDDRDEPLTLDDDLRARLRGWVREAARVLIEADGERVQGLLLAVGRDHLIVRSGMAEVLVPLVVVRKVSRRRGSSADAL